MREIKFRAWLRSYMYIPDYIDIEGKPIQFDVYDRILDPDKNAVLMQYTGLKDKNGVEIYEGDIVKIEGVISDNQGNKFTGFCTVKYVGMGFEFIPIENYTTKIRMISDSNICEIIGNIYENPELLNKENNLK